MILFTSLTLLQSVWPIRCSFLSFLSSEGPSENLNVSILLTVSSNKLGLTANQHFEVWICLGSWSIWVGSDESEFMIYLCHSILARYIIIRFCRAWRDVDLPSESGNRAVVIARPEMRRGECASSFHVSTGRTLVLTIRPWGPVFVFTVYRYCSVVKFILRGICKQYRKVCCVCVHVRVPLVTPQWSVSPYTELLISEGNQTFQKRLSSFFTLIISVYFQKRACSDKSLLNKKLFWTEANLWY